MLGSQIDLERAKIFQDLWNILWGLQELIIHKAHCKMKLLWSLGFMESCIWTEPVLCRGNYQHLAVVKPVHTKNQTSVMCVRSGKLVSISDVNLIFLCPSYSHAQLLTACIHLLPIKEIKEHEWWSYKVLLDFCWILVDNPFRIIYPEIERGSKSNVAMFLTRISPKGFFGGSCWVPGLICQLERTCVFRCWIDLIVA